jgi:dipeptidyl aminopeptidase/acylaminoacyl peptidase
MSELETRLASFREAADRTVFAGVEPGPELRCRVLAAAASAPTLPPPHRTALATRRPRGRLLLAAVGLAAGAALAAVAFRLGGEAAAAASLTVKPAGSDALLTVATVGDAAPTALPVELDSTSELNFRWSPDGSRLAFGRAGDLFVYDASTGATTNVTGTPDRWELLPSWSADGERLAFTSRPLEAGERPGEGAMVGVFGGSPAVVRPDGTGYRVLDDVTVAAAPSWSPGGLLAYSDGSAIRIADPVKGMVATLDPRDHGLDAPYVASPSWSPTRDELAVFYSESGRDPTREELLAGTAPTPRQGFALLALSERSTRVLYEYEAPFAPRAPARWSADGTRLALLFRPETAIADPVGVAVVTREGSLELFRPGLFAQVEWEPGGERLALHSEDVPDRLTILRPVDGASETEMLIFAGPIEAFAWRADTDGAR